MELPEPTIKRLIQLGNLLRQEVATGTGTISSTRIGKELGVEPHTVRKDINYLGGSGDTASGYNKTRLLEKINSVLGLQSRLKACIVGLGRLGEALIHYPQFEANGIDVVAAFDANINKLETLKTDIPLFPAYEMGEVIRSRSIEVAILAVPLGEAEKAMEKLTKTGVKGILNYTGAIFPIQTSEGIYVRNLDINAEMQMLKVLLNKKETLKNSIKF